MEQQPVGGEEALCTSVQSFKFKEGLFVGGKKQLKERQGHFLRTSR